MRRLVILRPEPGASASIAAARQLGLDAVAVPLFEVRPLAWTAPEPAKFDAILMTSANAARHGGGELAKLTALPVHAVGQATATAAVDAGFSVASVGAGTGEELVGWLGDGRRLLHLGGRHRRNLPAAEAIEVYESVEVAKPRGLGKLAGSVVAVHSPRAGRRLAELVADKQSIAIAAISAAAAAACGEGWEKLAYGSIPNDQGLLAVAAQLCETSGR